MAAPTTPHESPAGHLGAGFWVGAVIGGAIVAFGVHGLWVNERSGAISAAQWLVGGALLLDLVVVPVAALVGWATKRVVPRWAWPVARAALLTSAILIVVAAPLVTHQGGVPGNATVRPRDYGAGLAWALGLTWVIAGIGLLFIHLRSRD